MSDLRPLEWVLATYWDLVSFWEPLDESEGWTWDPSEKRIPKKTGLVFRKQMVKGIDSPEVVLGLFWRPVFPKVVFSETFWVIIVVMGWKIWSFTKKFVKSHTMSSYQIHNSCSTFTSPAIKSKN